MNNYLDFSESRPKDGTAIFIRNQELYIDVLAIFNVTSRVIVTEDFLVFKPSSILEWRYATQQEVSFSKGFQPLINQ